MAQEVKNHTRFASLTQDSFFKVHIEGDLKEMENPKQDQPQELEILEDFENNVTRMTNSNNISPYSFLQESGYMM